MDMSSLPDVIRCDAHECRTRLHSRSDRLLRASMLMGHMYVKLDGGDIGLISGGAGMTMGAMDMIREAGGEPACFLDASPGPASARGYKPAIDLLDGDPDTPPTVTYDLNRLQRLSTPEQYCLTLNPRVAIDESSVLGRYVYRHPLYDGTAIVAQRRWSEVSGVHRTHYCGAYWGYGFHEDGLNSALRVAGSLGVSW